MDGQRQGHQIVLDTIRGLLVESGATPPYDESIGIEMNNTYRIPEGEMQVDFDYGSPVHLFTEDGFYHIKDRGIHRMSDSDKFWELFTTEFEVEIIEPFQSVVGREMSESGPLVRVKLRP